MPKTKKEKEKILEKIREKIRKSKTILFLDFTGLKADAFFELRRKINLAKKALKVVKKTLAQMAFDKEDKKVNVKDLKGQLALAFGSKEDLTLIKLIFQFSKKNPNLKILGGLMDSEILEKEEIEKLATLPSKEELLANLLMSFSAPLSNFVFVLRANLQNFLFLLSQIKGQKEK